MKLHIPIRLPSLANCRMHWRKLASIKKSQRTATYYYLKKINENIELPKLPLVITITRIGPRKLDDDNLQSACKYVRDEIARYIGTDDGSLLYEWRYTQKKGKYGVDIEITSR